jgi:hypothetical protein
LAERRKVANVILEKGLLTEAQIWEHFQIEAMTHRSGLMSASNFGPAKL